MDFEFGFKTLWPVQRRRFGLGQRYFRPSEKADKRIDDLKGATRVKLSYHTKQDAKADSINIAAA